MMALFLSLFFSLVALAQSGHYRNFAELAAHNVEGRDYQIVIRERGARALVMAFHGGLIEPGTSELAETIAGEEFSFYTFKGLLNDGDQTRLSRLHLTSTRFDEPNLRRLVSSSRRCLSTHGLGFSAIDFCVGGGDAKWRKTVTKKLQDKFPAFLACELCCPPLNGTSRLNPVNGCDKEGGVQLEMSPQVRTRILEDEAFKRELSDLLRETF